MVSKGEKESAENRLSGKRPTSTRAFLKASGLLERAGSNERALGTSGLLERAGSWNERTLGESRDGSLSLKVREFLRHHWSTHIGDPLSLAQFQRFLKSGRKSVL
jgi:hypothetical protein